MSTLFPRIENEDDFEAYRHDGDVWRPVMAAITQRHGLVGECTLFEQGCCVLFGVGREIVVKLFEPGFMAHFETERRVMPHLDAALPVASPHLMAADQLEGWGYLVMTRCPGQPMNQVWDALPTDDQMYIVEQIGELAAAIHALPVGELTSLPPPWATFWARQMEGMAARHAEQGLPAPMLAALQALIRSTPFPETRPVLLHTELTSLNLLVDRAPGGRWRLSGVVDFEPCMVGLAEYDLVAPVLFVCLGDRALFRRFLRAYGYAPGDLNDPLVRRLMCHTVLHRYSNLGYFWGRQSSAVLPSDLGALMARFFPL